MFLSNISKFSSRETLEEYCQNLTKVVLDLKDYNLTLCDKIAAMKSEHYKDEQLKEISERLKALEKDYYRGFPISEGEMLAIQKWQEEHEISQHNNKNHYHGCSGGGYSYIFYPTAIGTSAVCKCDACAAAATKYACEDGNYDRKKYIEYLKQHNGSFEFKELG